MIYRSPHADVEIPALSLSEFVFEHADTFAERAAFVHAPTGQATTYRTLVDDISATAAGLAHAGIRRGTVVAIFSPNRPEYAVAFHAVARAGGACTTINPVASADELAFQLRDAQARFLVTTPELMERARPVAAREGIERVFVFGQADGAEPFASLSSDAAPASVAIDPVSDLVSLPYSSGTTGLSKGVMLTHANLVANVCQLEPPIMPIGEGDVLVAILPFFHIYGQTFLLNLALRRGATVVTIERFELESFLQTLQDQRVTVGYLAPPLVLMLAKHPAVDGYDLSALRFIMSGAAPLSDEVASRCAERIDCEVFQGYGLTEASPVTNITPPGLRPRRASVGPLAPNTEGRLVDPATGGDAAAGVGGELWIRGPQVMAGYLANDEATAATIVEDGWLRTGDIATVDADGWFTIVDRLKELIKCNGYQVPPAQLEALLLTHPAISDAAVIGIADEAYGEVPKAFVVANGEPTAEDLMAFVADRVAPYKRIRSLEFVDAIPKSASGKILRRVLAQREDPAGGIGTA